MSFEEDDEVVLHDEHSEHDGEVGIVQSVSETMFGDEQYVISFEDGQEAGIAADSLTAAEETYDEDDEE
ncbi:DUF1918 domain-containing protein [Halosegnis rubeus]|jgi:hypothetical protein|uniref:DUF1918 domain-containing protein n=1 Tax=Halosegnis rubeus TaxID=2212850 RepID=A0A5N5UNS7_9EURY|nr:DUF1918 domain-containing protein [Halosegnis rubeus]KAB7513756.1 DUF1918 domain-containing protein [Halosegnis rubeus]KAB7514157.1 DUF1918 domain-containing protein [Halosegnis rubeus]KAB7518993.1 DUF1918 domain-containing protein [Halosegnis rubeus]